jgi:MFS family permease
MFKFHYFNGNLTQGFTALFSGRMIQFTANALLGLFMPIFLLTKFGLNVSYVFLYYLVGYFLYAFILPWGAQLLNKIGLRRSLRISITLASLFYASLFLLDYNVILFVILSFVLLTLYRITFWYPFHIDFAKFTKANDRGKNVSLIWAAHSFLTIIMPVISGFLIVKYGFNVIILITIIVYMSSYIPFMTLPRTRERFAWNYRQTLKHFFKKENRGMVIAHMANGAEMAVTMVIWPIFIWQLLEGNYFNVGAISSLIVLAAVILQLAVGKYADIISKRKMIHWGSMFYALGWIVKIFVLTSFQIFLAGAYHSFAKIFKDTPFDALNYDLMADHGHYVDEYTVIKEMAVNLGKALILVFAILVALNFGINWTFVLAALASLFINLL